MAHPENDYDTVAFPHHRLDLQSLFVVQGAIISHFSRNISKKYSETMIANQESVGFRAAIASCLVATICAFQTSPSFSRVGSALKVAVDPSTITNKEYEDICGVSFNEQSLHQRLQSTKFLYPKHVEVIEDIGPLAGRMVDEIVSP